MRRKVTEILQEEGEGARMRKIIKNTIAWRFWALDMENDFGKR
jgi:hypothetical protein